VKLRKILSLGFKVAISASLLYFLFTKVDIASVGNVLTQAHISYLFIGWLSYMAIMALCSMRWRVFTAPLGFNHGIYKLLLYSFAGAFFNMFLPTSLGGDVGRAYYLSRKASSKSKKQKGKGRGLSAAIVSVIADRFMGFFALLIIASCALLVRPDVVSALPPLITTMVLWTLAVLLFAMLVPFFFGKYLKRFGKTVLDSMVYWKKPFILINALFFSILIQLLDVVVNIFIGFSLDLNIPILYYFILTPLTIVASMFPASVAGLGVREGSYVYLLSAVGVPEETGMAVALGWLFIILTGSIIGAIILVTGILEVPWEHGRTD